MENQKDINIYDFSLTIENMEKINKQMKNNICIIKNSEKIVLGIGYLCKVKLESKILPMLIILKDMINENEKNNNIFISFNDKKDLEIKINIQRKKIKIKNIILIEIKPNIDKIKLKYFNELDSNEKKNKFRYIYNTLYKR